MIPSQFFALEEIRLRARPPSQLGGFDSTLCPNRPHQLFFFTVCNFAAADRLVLRHLRSFSLHRLLPLSFSLLYSRHTVFVTLSFVIVAAVLSLPCCRLVVSLPCCRLVVSSPCRLVVSSPYRLVVSSLCRLVASTPVPLVHPPLSSPVPPPLSSIDLSLVTSYTPPILPSIIYDTGGRREPAEIF